MTASPTRLNVLVVEDDALWRRIIRHTLGKQNVRVVEASTVAEACAQLDADPFDAVFVDYELPDGCGLDVLDVIERPRLGRLVLASGYVDPEDLMDPRAVMVDRFLTKPFLSGDLVGCIEDVTPSTELEPTGQQVI